MYNIEQYSRISLIAKRLFSYIYFRTAITFEKSDNIWNSLL